MSSMADAKRATVYFENDVHKALRLKSAETERSVSDLVNEAVRAQLAEDEDDMRAFRGRAKETAIPFEDFLRDMKRRGKL